MSPCRDLFRLKLNDCSRCLKKSKVPQKWPRKCSSCFFNNDSVYFPHICYTTENKMKTKYTIFIFPVEQSNLVRYEQRSPELLLLHVHVDLNVDDLHEDHHLHPDRLHAGRIVPLCSLWIVLQCSFQINFYIQNNSFNVL